MIKWLDDFIPQWRGVLKFAGGSAIVVLLIGICIGVGLIFLLLLKPDEPNIARLEPLASPAAQQAALGNEVTAVETPKSETSQSEGETMTAGTETPTPVLTSTPLPSKTPTPKPTLTATPVPAFGAPYVSNGYVVANFPSWKTSEWLIGEREGMSVDAVVLDRDYIANLRITRSHWTTASVGAEDVRAGLALSYDNLGTGSNATLHGSSVIFVLPGQKALLFCGIQANENPTEDGQPWIPERHAGMVYNPAGHFEYDTSVAGWQQAEYLNKGFNKFTPCPDTSGTYVL